MPLFKNITNHSVNLNVNGVLRPVNSGGFVNIPNNLVKLYLKNPDLSMVGKLTADVMKDTSNAPPKREIASSKRPHLFNPLKNIRAQKTVVNSVVSDDDSTIPIVYEDAPPKYTDVLSFMKRNFNDRVSICILTVDNYNVIKRCIDSIEKHIKYKNFEVLIGDTGSKDQRVLDLYKKLDTKRYKVFTGMEFNFSKNNNFLVSKATGDFVVIMNNDVFVTYDSLPQMVKLLHFYPIGSVGTRLIFDDHRGIIQHDGQTIHDGNRWTGLGHVNLNRAIRDVPGIDGYVCGNTGAFVMYRKHTFNEVGGFDEGYLDIFQDVDLNLKISARGFKHFCLRKNYHIHVDHGTRHEGPHMGQERIKEIKSDQAKIHNDWLTTKKPPSFKRPTFSFIISATEDKSMSAMCSSIGTKVSHEMFVANNKRNTFRNASEILNMGMQLSNSKYNILCHQDIIFSKGDSLDAVVERIGDIEKANNNWGVLGIAGAGWEGAERVFHHYMPSYGKKSGNYKEIQTVDEFLMIVKNNGMLEMDTQVLDHWHFYGADICLSAQERGFANYVINIPVTHLSNGLVNLTKHFNEYKVQCRRLLSKWRDKFPRISTTTMQFSNNMIMYFATPHGGEEKEKLD